MPSDIFQFVLQYEEKNYPEGSIDSRLAIIHVYFHHDRFFFFFSFNDISTVYFFIGAQHSSISFERIIEQMSIYSHHSWQLLWQMKKEMAMK